MQNVAGLRCLYNDDLANDAAFLIDQAEQVLEAGGSLPLGWNITLSEPKFVRGATAAGIVEDLFRRLVPLALRETVGERLDSDDHSHTTRNVRRTVRELMRKHMNLKTAPDFWRSKPTQSVQDGGKVSLDLQIVGTGHDAGEIRGAIASAWYKTQYHRSAYLDRAATAVLRAHEVYPNALNVLYLLQPQAGGDFSGRELAEIQDEVDGTQWLLKRNGARLNVFESERAMAHTILEDLAIVGG
ncbi:hypothetical protein [Variovorax ginsengisoli]|uniref:Restriction endonuclease n=1 Tax=Variovorax ginsengisoli TaxID=363844 RepID=A0ABT8S769_9BURK|nr:hypothetical protein [Variovorax ginsengisoli]MDN8615495.1 hypothetical protein [Variovorax ginsengisoli]MDO1534665.1 hypothetical protein [Variovorax ginsengisoli]